MVKTHLKQKQITISTMHINNVCFIISGLATETWLPVCGKKKKQQQKTNYTWPLFLSYQG